MVIESLPYCGRCEASHSHLLAIAVLVVLLQGSQANLLPSAQNRKTYFWQLIHIVRKSSTFKLNNNNAPVPP